MTAAELWREMMDLIGREDFATLKATLIEADTDAAFGPEGGELGTFLDRAIDPGMVTDFSRHSALAVDQSEFMHGRRGFAEAWRVFLAPWSNLEIADAQVEELDRHRALTWATWKLRGEASGAALEVPTCAIWTVRDDRFVRMEAFLSEQAARDHLERS